MPRACFLIVFLCYSEVVTNTKVYKRILWKRCMNLPLKQIREQNNGILGRPIADVPLFEILDDSIDMEWFEQMVAGYLFSSGTEDDEHIRVSAEQELRMFFGNRTPQFVVTHHSPSCRRDIFLSYNDSQSYIYVGSSSLGENEI